MSCEAIQKALASFHACEMTPEGAKVKTHCLMPSFKPVSVFVVGYGDGFIVHDSGQAYASSWLHGRDHSLILRSLSRQALRYGALFENGQISVKVETIDWLGAAIMAVANAAAAGANEALSRFVKSQTERLGSLVYNTLVQSFAAKRVAREVERRGESGRVYSFDFAVSEGGKVAVIDVITPHAASIAHKYTAFSDSHARQYGGAFAVHDAALDQEDEALLTLVADVVPYSHLTAGVGRSLNVSYAQ